MPTIIFLPIFEEENEQCFCVNQSTMNLLRKDGEEEMILYFSKSFWDRYPKPFGMEKMFEIIQNVKVPVEYIGVISEWKYLDKYARTHFTNVDVPSSYDQLINESECISLLIDKEYDDVVNVGDGWGTLCFPDLFSRNDEVDGKYFMDKNVEKKLITLEMMESKEKIVRYYNKDLGEINISIN